MKWVKRTHLTAVKLLDGLETKFGQFINWSTEKLKKYLYDYLFLRFMYILIVIFQILLYIPLFIGLIPFSIAVNIFEYTKSTKIPKKIKNDLDKIN